MSSAEGVLLVGGIIAFSTTLFMVRRREMREKYATAWIIAAFLFLAFSFAMEPLTWLAIRLRVTPSAIVLMGALFAAYIFAFSVTVSLSRHYRRNVRLAQEIALLEQRIRQLEAGLKVSERP